MREEIENGQASLETLNIMKLKAPVSQNAIDYGSQAQ